jgi:hypothetical protein
MYATIRARTRATPGSSPGREDTQRLDPLQRPSTRRAWTPQGRTAPHRTAPHRTAPHRTAPHRTAPHRTAPHRTKSVQVRLAFLRAEIVWPGHQDDLVLGCLVVDLSRLAVTGVA